MQQPCNIHMYIQNMIDVIQIVAHVITLTHDMDTVISMCIVLQHNVLVSLLLSGVSIVCVLPLLIIILEVLLTKLPYSPTITVGGGSGGGEGGRKQERSEASCVKHNQYLVEEP